MSHNSSQIEKIAITRVTSLFLLGQKINPWLNQGDKEPLWDGFLYLYSSGSEEWANRTMRGRVACQIKGRDSSADNDTETYSVEICDLENYMRDGGVLFFLVNTSYEKQPVYWAQLAPVDIRGYLEKAKGQKTTIIKLERIPNRIADCEQAVFDFYEHCQLQRKPPVDISSISRVKQFKVLVKVDNGEPPILAITKGFQYLYSSDGNGGFGNPIGDTRFSITMAQKIAESFKVGDEEFQVPVNLEFVHGSAILKFGRFMKMDLKRNDGEPSQLKFNADILFGVRERSVALGVLLAMDASNTINVRDEKLSCAEVILSSEQKGTIQAELQNSKKVVTLLDTLHVKDDLDLESLSKKERNELNTLYKAIIENQSVNPETTQEDIQIVNVKIGPLTIKVWLIKENGTYKVYDFFGQDYVIAVSRGDNESKHEVGRFVLLNQKDYVHVSNIDWALIPSDYARIYKDDPVVLQQANQDALNMLSAYDECGRIELVNAVLRLTDWLVKVCDTNDRVIYRVNQLQTIKRTRELSDEEISELVSFSENKDASLELKYCCALLLGEIQRAEYHFKNMSQEMRDFYRKLPISKFQVS